MDYVNIFVYGSLMKSGSNHQLMKSAHFLGQDVLDNTELVDMGTHPILIPGKGTVYGECYRVSYNTLEILDRLEGHPNYYRRRWVYLKSGRHAIVYEGNEERAKGYPRIPSGRWRSELFPKQHDKDREKTLVDSSTYQFLYYLRSLDIKLFVDGDKLRCNAPKGVITQTLQEELVERKVEILAFLSQTNTVANSNLPSILPAPDDGNPTLSYAQTRLWFLNQLEPDSTAYNMPAAYGLTGILNVTALEQSLNEIWQRHSILRSTFPSVDGQPSLAILKDINFILSLIDLEKIPQPERVAQAQHLATQEAEHNFDLAQGQLFRAKLLRLTATEHVLLLTMHHIIYDGWSYNIFFQELAALYTAFCAGQPTPLTKLPIQYPDFAVWQRQWLQGEVLESQLSYWKQQLGGSLSVLQLPTDYPHPPVQTYRGAYQSLELPQNLVSALKSVAVQSGVTLFMTLLAAFKILLYRYSGQEDIIVGTPIAGRNQIETEGLIGLFVNSLAIRTNLSPSQSFQQLLSQVREVTLGAYSHQDLPLEKLIEELQPSRDTSRSPLFQVMFVFQNTPSQPCSLPGLTITPQFVHSGTAKFDLTLNLGETAEGIKGGIEYNTDLFESATITRMVGHFQTLLEGIVANPQQHISDLPLLTAAERHQLLVEWNDTAVDYPQDKCLHQLFEEQVERTPDAVAVVFENKQLTYRELNGRANQLAHYLRSLGVGADVLVGICVERSLEMVVGLLGILKAGGAYVPLDPEYPQERLSFMLKDSQVSVLLTQQHLVEKIPEHQENLVCLDTDWQVIAQWSQDNLNTDVQPDNLAYVIYTSGSTGKPKGAMNIHNAICNRLLWMQQAYQLTTDDVVLQKTPFSFDVSVWEFFWTLLNGSRLVMAQPGKHRDSEYLVDVISQQQVTTLHFVPSMLQVFLSSQNLELCHNLRRVICSGEALSLDLQAKFFQYLGCELHNLYGPTEAAIDVTFWECQKQSQLQTVPIGRPIANTQIYILDQNLQPVPVGIPGELHIGGAGLARGYLNRPELTQEKFIPNPFDNTRLYKTGDLARYLPSGEIEYLGRIDNQVKIRGFRIELGEIETILNQHPQVQTSCVIARSDVPGDKRLVAYIVSAETAPTQKELREYLKGLMPDYMVPSAFVLLESLPLTPNGKIDRRALPFPDLDSEQQEKYAPPRNPTEEILAHLWAEILNLKQVGIHDNFFELGGHSLLATQLISRIRSHLQVELPLRQLFVAPTVASLAQVIQQSSNLQQNLPPIVKRDNNSDLPLSYAQTRLWFIEQFQPDTATYNIPFALRLEGNLQVTALEQSIQEIIQRHEALRTNLLTIDGQANQIIHSQTNWTLSIVDWSNVSTNHQEIDVVELLQQQAIAPFDLGNDCLIRATLITLSGSEHILFVCMHHIVSDGWSMGVFVQELQALYNAYSQGQPSPLSPLPIQYADFALWQRQWLQGEVLQRQLSYWQSQLADAPALLSLPTDRPRPAVQTFAGAHQQFALSVELTQKLTQLSQSQGVTLFMTLLAGYKTLLYRYTGVSDIVVGSPIANRHYSEIEGLIGFFVNTLVLRTDLSENPSFCELLNRVRDVSLGAYAHQDLPFEMLVEALQPERDLSYTPLFQVMFVLQNAPLDVVELNGLSVSPIATEYAISKFDLTLSMENTAQGLVGVWEYNTDLFDVSTIERLTGHFVTLLTGIVANPQQEISQLPLLTAAEQQQLLVEWNDTAVEYPQDKCIHKLFEAQVQRTPDALAVIFENQQLTYQQLNHRANQLAHYLISLGVKPETPVGICVERSLNLIISLLAILKAGAAYVPLDPAYPQERLAFMLTDAAVPVLLTQKQLIDKLPSHPAKVVCLDTDWEAISTENSQNPQSEVKPTNLAYLIYTSGSTGKPKGVQITHRSVVNFLTAMQQHLQLTNLDSLLSVTSLSFDIAVLEIFLPLIIGAKVILVSREVTVDGLQLLKQLNNSAATVMQATPATWRMLLEAGWKGNTQLKILCGGEALSQNLANQLRQRGTEVWNLYGPTETTVWSTIHRIDQQEALVTIGRPIANTQIYILDKYLQPVPVGVPGELYIGGASLARGYLHQQELTKEKFIHNPFSSDSFSRLYKTGDLARYLADGNIEFLGRLDNQVKVRGFRIELGEIESAIALHPSVQQTVVTARVDDTGDKRLVAYIVPQREQTSEQSRSTPTTDQLRHFLKQKLPEYMVPSAFVFLDTLPLTPNGKIDRNALPDPDSTKLDSENTYVAPRDSLELQLTNIWEQVLGIQPIGVRDNFFSVGGHSLLAVRLFAQIEKALKKNLPLAILFQAPTIEELAKIIGQSDQSELSKSWSYLVPIQPLGSKPPLFLAHGLGGHGLSFVDLVSYLGSEQPVYGLQARGLDGKTAPITRLEDMATNYIHEIRTLQPKGPYFLGGHSFGGLLAFEIAQQLYAQGEEVALLALFDSGGVYSPISFGNWLSVHLTNLSQMEFKEKLDYIWDRASWHIKWMIPKPIRKIYTYLNQIDSSSQALRHLSVLETNLQAMKHYVIRPFPGIVTLFRASLKSPSSSSDPQAGWGKLALGGVEIHDVPGDHTTLLKEPNLSVLAEKLKACLNKAQAN